MRLALCERHEHWYEPCDRDRGWETLPGLGRGPAAALGLPRGPATVVVVVAAALYAVLAQDGLLLPYCGLRRMQRGIALM